MKYLKIFLLFVSIISAQNKLPDFKYEKVGDNFYLLQVFIEGNKLGANVGLFVSKSGLLMIDTHFKGLYPWLRNSFSKVTDKKIKYIVNTHWHPDHNSGNSFLNNEAPIIANENVAKRLSSKQVGIGLDKPGNRIEFKPRAKEEIPAILFKDRKELKLDGTDIELIHYPNAHTDGDCIVIINSEKVAYLSDLIWPGEYPFVDVYTGGSVYGLIDALKNIYERTNDNFVYVSGHANTINRQELKEYIKMIESSVAAVNENKDSDTDKIKLKDSSKWESTLVPKDVWINMILKSVKHS